jgi:hypothetical protein
LAEALEILSYDNARGVLKRAGEMVRTLVAIGAGRAGGRADNQTDGRKGGRAVGPSEEIAKEAPLEMTGAVEELSPEDTALPPYRPTAG